ncbi:MAG: LysR family transcriptional regulator [Sphaerochaeta sp.]
MELRKITYFVEVARLKSFSKAALVLYVSQTAVSQQIAVLEDEVGAKLFNRDKKTVQLTAAGEVFLTESQRLLRQYENAILKAREVEKGYQGILRIGFFSMFDREVIAPILATFHAAWPKVKISIVQCNFRDMKTNILNDTIDVGFSFCIDSEEIEELKVRETYPKLCVHKDHHLASKTLIEKKDLKGAQVISYIKNREQLACYETHHSEENPGQLSNKSFLVENMDDAIMLVSINAGICFLPEVKSFVNQEKIIFIDQTVEDVPFAVNAYWIRDNKNVVLQKFLSDLEADTSKL